MAAKLEQPTTVHAAGSMCCHRLSVELLCTAETRMHEILTNIPMHSGYRCKEWCC